MDCFLFKTALDSPQELFTHLNNCGFPSKTKYECTFADCFQTFGKKNSLYEEQRNLLINTICKYVEAKGVEFSLSECSAIEKEICSIFPSEQLVSIYVSIDWF